MRVVKSRIGSVFPKEPSCAELHFSLRIPDLTWVNDRDLKDIIAIAFYFKVLRRFLIGNQGTCLASFHKDRAFLNSKVRTWGMPLACTSSSTKVIAIQLYQSYSIIKNYLIIY